MLRQRSEADALDGWTVTTALMATSRSDRLDARGPSLERGALAQAVATADRIAPQRLRFLASVGDHLIDALRPAGRGSQRAHRATRRDARRLPAGRRDGHPARSLRRARGARACARSCQIRIEIAAKGPHMLDLVARHADVWDVICRRCSRASRERVQSSRSIAAGPVAIRARSNARCGSSRAWAPVMTQLRHCANIVANPWFD